MTRQETFDKIVTHLRKQGTKTPPVKHGAAKLVYADQTADLPTSPPQDP